MAEIIEVNDVPWKIDPNHCEDALDKSFRTIDIKPLEDILENIEKPYTLETCQQVSIKKMWKDVLAEYAKYGIFNGRPDSFFIRLSAWKWLEVFSSKCIYIRDTKADSFTLIQECKTYSEVYDYLKPIKKYCEKMLDIQ
jgi:hypothetical protein